MTKIDMRMYVKKLHYVNAAPVELGDGRERCIIKDGGNETIVRGWEFKSEYDSLEDAIKSLESHLEEDEKTEFVIREGPPVWMCGNCNAVSEMKANYCWKCGRNFSHKYANAHQVIAKAKGEQE